MTARFLMILLHQIQFTCCINCLSEIYPRTLTFYFIYKQKHTYTHPAPSCFQQQTFEASTQAACQRLKFQNVPVMIVSLLNSVYYLCFLFTNSPSSENHTTASAEPASASSVGRQGLMGGSRTRLVSARPR